MDKPGSAWPRYPQAAAEFRRPLLLDEAEQDTWLAPDTPLPALISLLAKPQPNLRSVALAGFVNKPETDGPECLTPA